MKSCGFEVSDYPTQEFGLRVAFCKRHSGDPGLRSGARPPSLGDCDKCLAAAVLSNSTLDGTLLDSLAYEHTCTLGLFKASRKNLKLKNIERSTLDGHSVRRQA
jgi:hypothetical protein